MVSKTVTGIMIAIVLLLLGGLIALIVIFTKKTKSGGSGPHPGTHPGMSFKCNKKLDDLGKSMENGLSNAGNGTCTTWTAELQNPSSAYVYASMNNNTCPTSVSAENVCNSALDLSCGDVKYAPYFNAQTDAAGIQYWTCELTALTPEDPATLEADFCKQLPKCGSGNTAQGWGSWPRNSSGRDTPFYPRVMCDTAYSDTCTQDEAEKMCESAKPIVHNGITYNPTWFQPVGSAYTCEFRPQVQ